ncbi:pyridoxal-phosphate dependent enzyme [Escherichia coli]
MKARSSCQPPPPISKLMRCAASAAKCCSTVRTLMKRKPKAIELSQQQGFTRVPPFDHPMVIAGQGTLALELLQQDAHLDRVFVPVGGGGLAAGVAVLIKQLMPQIKSDRRRSGRLRLPESSAGCGSSG